MPQRAGIFSSRLAWAGTAFAGYTAVMLTLERQMHRSGGPGIIAFELAGNAERAHRIMSAWGDDGRRAARRSLHHQLDFGYVTSLMADAVSFFSRGMRV